MTSFNTTQELLEASDLMKRYAESKRSTDYTIRIEYKLREHVMPDADWREVIEPKWDWSTAQYREYQEYEKIPLDYESIYCHLPGQVIPENADGILNARIVLQLLGACGTGVYASIIKNRDAEPARGTVVFFSFEEIMAFKRVGFASGLFKFKYRG